MTRISIITVEKLRAKARGLMEDATPATGIAERREVIFYNRPEHLGWFDTGIPARIAVVEPTGTETQMFLRARGRVWRRCSASGARSGPGNIIHLTWRKGQVYLSDPERGARI